ncbi:MAG: choice-of-anchor Q domain-containing protein [Bradyrhizobium sp.]
MAIVFVRQTIVRAAMVLLVGAIFARVAGATTVSVPADYTTIEAAIEAAAADSEITEIVVGKADDAEYPVTYTFTAMQTVNTALTIRGATGNFGDVIVSGGGTCHPFWVENSGAELADLTVADGYDGGGNAGGVILIKGTMRNCRVTGCVGGYVGGIYLRYGTVVDCVVDGNSVGAGHYNGGGIFMQKPECLVERTVITNNYSRSWTYGNNNGGGTGVYLQDGTMRNCVVAFNDGNKINIDYVQLTPAVGVYAAGGTIENSTIYGNFCGNGAYAGFAGLTATSGAKIVNTLVMGNGNPEVNFASDFSGDESVLDHSIVNPAANQYRLDDSGLPVPVLGSVLVDAGVETATSATATDLAGNPRTVGAAVDVGAFEFQEPDSFTVAIIAPQLEFTSLEPVDLSAVVACAGSAATYAWSASGEGVVFSEPNALATKVTVPDFGRYEIVFAATDGSVAAESSIEIVFKPTVVYVDSASAGGAYPYHTKETAAASIETAAAALAPGGEIVLVKGTRIVRETILSLAGSLTIRGETGDFDDAVIDGGAVCVPVRLQAGQTLAGVTVTA